MHRMVTFAHQSQLKLQLVYYPSYHSKYNPLECTFGWLEQHRNGSLLDSVDTVLHFAQILTFKGSHPVATLVEQQIQRLPHLPKWFVEIKATAT